MSKLPPHLASKSKEELESMCTDCGMCCHPAVELDTGDKIVVPDIACKNLERDSDGKTKCTVYPRRLDKSVAGKWCRELSDGIEEGIFPKECPYVIDMPDYEGPRLIDVPLYRVLRKQVAKTVTSHDCPEWADVGAWKSLAEAAR